MPADTQLSLGMDAELYNEALRQATQVTNLFGKSLGTLTKIMATQSQTGVTLTKMYEDQAGVLRKITGEAERNKEGFVVAQGQITQAAKNTTQALKDQLQAQEDLQNAMRRGLGQDNATRRPNPLSNPNNLSPEAIKNRDLMGAVESQTQTRIRSLRENIQARAEFDALADKMIKAEERRSQQRLANSKPQTPGPAFNPNDLTPAAGRNKSLTSLADEVAGDRVKSLRENIQARAEFDAMAEKMIKAAERRSARNAAQQTRDEARQVAGFNRERRRLAQQALAWEKFQNGPFLEFNRIRQRAQSLFEVVSVFRVLDASVQGFVKGLQNAIDLSVRIGEIQTIDRAAVSYDNLFASVIKLSSEFGETPQKVAEALYQTVSNQIATGEAAVQFVRESTKFALATVTSVDKAVNTLSSTLNSYNLGLSRTAEISANFFKTIELGRIRAEDFQASIGDLSNLSQQVGVSYQELNAAIALTTIQGVKPAEAFTRIRNILIKLIKPTDDMKKALASFGYESGESALQALGFGGVLQKLEEYTQGSATRTAELFGNIRAITGAFIFAGDGLSRYNSVLAESANNTLQYDNAINTILDNSGKKIIISLQVITNSFTNFGNDVIKAVNEIQRNYAKLEDVVLGVAKVTAALLVAGGISGLTAAAVSAGRALYFMAAGADAAAAGATALRISTGGWIGIAAGAVTLLIELGIWWQKYADSLREVARQEASNRSNAFLETRTKDFAEASRLIELGIREEAQRATRLIAIRQQQRNAIIDAAEEEFERTKYLNEAVKDDFLETYNASKAIVVNAYRDMRTTARNAIEEMSKAQNEGIAQALEFQLDRATSPRAKASVIKNAIGTLKQQLVAAAGSANLPEFNRIVSDIQSLLSKQYAIEQSVAGEYGIRRAAIAAEQRQNDFLQERLNLLSSLGVKAKQLADQQRQDAIRAAADQNRISALSQTVFGFKPSDISKLTDIEEIRRVNQDAQAAAAELRRVTTDQKQLAVLNERAAAISLQAANKIAIINEEDRRNRLTGKTVALQNRITDLDKLFTATKEDRINLEKAGRLQAEGEFNARLSELSMAVARASAIIGMALPERAARVAFLNQKSTFEAEIVQNFTATQDEKLKLLDATIKGLKGQFAPLGVNFDKADIPNEFEAAATAAADLALEFNNLARVAAGTYGAPLFGTGFASGGRTDVVPAMLTPGEFVMNRNASSKFYSQLSHMNSGTQARGYQTGGSIGDVTINVQSDRTPEHTARAIRRELQSLQRQNVR